MRRMAKHIPIYRRRREGRTDYNKRRRILSGKRPILVIRRSTKHTYAQIIEYNADGDRVLVSAASRELEKYGWIAPKGNVPSAYLTGLLLAKKALGKGIKEAIPDLGMYTSTRASRIYAALKGVREGGLDISCDEKILPDDERVSGKHIAEFAKMLRKDKEKYSKYFSDYIKKGVDPEKIGDLFTKSKSEILK